MDAVLRSTETINEAFNELLSSGDITAFTQNPSFECATKELERCAVKSVSKLLRAAISARSLFNEPSANTTLVFPLSTLVETMSAATATLLPKLAPNTSDAFDVKTEMFHYALHRWEQLTFPGLQWPTPHTRDNTGSGYYSDYDDEITDLRSGSSGGGDANAAVYPSGVRFELPPNVLRSENGEPPGNLTVAVAVYSLIASSMLFPFKEIDGGEVLVSSVISVQLSTVENGDTLNNNLTLYFNVPYIRGDGSTTSNGSGSGSEDEPAITAAELACVWWNVATLDWDESGCSIVESRTPEADDTVACTCSHLTHFAVMFKPEKAVATTASGVLHTKALTIITYIGSAVSIICLLATFIIFAVHKQLREFQQQILMHMIAGLIAWQILFFFITPKAHAAPVFLPDGEVVVAQSCKAVAGLMHYALLVAWTWMVIDGYYLREKLVVVFTGYVEHSWKYVAVGWGLPGVLVAISGGIWSEDYGFAEACWIKQESDAMYMLYIPVFVGLLIDVYFFCSVIWSVWLHLADHSHSASKQMVKAAITFAATLSLNYVFAFLVVVHGGRVWDYLFALSVGIQGVLIFYFHCANKGEVRKAVLGNLTKTSKILLQTSSMTTSSARAGSAKPTKKKTSGKLNLQRKQYKRTEAATDPVPVAVDTTEVVTKWSQSASNKSTSKHSTSGENNAMPAVEFEINDDRTTHVDDGSDGGFARLHHAETSFVDNDNARMLQFEFDEDAGVINI
jgi:hypothetical protein